MYKSKLIIIRGNSASGKSTVAKRIRELSDRRIAYVEQDNIRRTILKEKETDDGVNIALIKMVTEFALARNYDVILEGMLKQHSHGEMMKDILGVCTEAYVFYFDVSFEVTLQRHATKPIADEVSEEMLKAWFKDKDLTGFPGEYVIPEDFTVEQAALYIIKTAGL